MRILLLGDIMGHAGREALAKYLPDLKRRLAVDVTVVNGENTADGRGITGALCEQLYRLGADCITTGNHVWDRHEVIAYIDGDPRLLRPANSPEGTPGHGLYLHRLGDGRRLAVINVMGRLFMNRLGDPFKCAERLLASCRLGHECDAAIVDFHGEAASEKMAFAHCFDGRLSAVIGTHTHIPTADAHILPGGTAYMSDAGMCGDYDSVIGIRKTDFVRHFTSPTPENRLEPADSNRMLCGVLVITDDSNGLATVIAPIRIGDILGQALPAV